jgi:hypothetical protein
LRFEIFFDRLSLRLDPRFRPDLVLGSNPVLRSDPGFRLDPDLTLRSLLNKIVAGKLLCGSDANFSILKKKTIWIELRNNYTNKNNLNSFSEEYFSLASCFTFLSREKCLN